ncbi:PREDICTED: uncharacterized protein LOC104823441 [Tarenaya hassleriana]|uniref:uncharacterized protein LOC104823441 n=1 Tax=Tarenaya hassleriana TaxID=28532 RepID=UPI00053C213C|nr:PREDICTED: uncharacterized protein LOC104823441 [Tarenaya hassleriana]XP_010553312.1 PREDICTED: uncharacterized protein LOC104823441 [Tarenaya hassleriana]XP_010553313.1 PREDICTED: uncharacterized protein LOC104823441 [Tarenaya hassleriana]
MLIHAYNDNTQCRTNCTSEKMEKDEEGLRTVECLRGRLLAERHDSRTAKEEAELMTIKIAELEANLKEEIKLRERAERRLGFLMKKLESLNGSRNIERSDQSSSAELSAASCVSSVVSSKENDQEANTQITNPDKTRVCDDLEEDQVTANGHSAVENRSAKLEDIRCGSKTSVASSTSHEEHHLSNFPVQQQAQEGR